MSKKKRKKHNHDSGRPKAKKGRAVISFAVVLALMASGYLLNDLINRDATPIVNLDRQAPTELNPSLLRGGENRPTLSPARFTGKVARAYRIAEQNRDLLDSMYCYCNCKKTIGHKSLLSCFADQHAVWCDICRDEAFYAVAQHQNGLDILAVRKAVDKRFWRPFS